MSIPASLKTAITSVASTATGGIYTEEDVGRLGVNRTTLAAAFTSGIIRPTIYIKSREARAVPGQGDVIDNREAAEVVIEFWLYQHTGYTTINTMRGAIFDLLHLKQVSGVLQIRWVGDVRGQRDTDLDASVERSDYVVTYINRGG